MPGGRGGFAAGRAERRAGAIISLWSESVPWRRRFHAGRRRRIARFLRGKGGMRKSACRKKQSLPRHSLGGEARKTAGTCAGPPNVFLRAVMGPGVRLRCREEERPEHGSRGDGGCGRRAGDGKKKAPASCEAGAGESCRGPYGAAAKAVISRCGISRRV